MNVGVTGHQDIPPEAASHIRTQIAGELAGLPAPVIGVTALAAGADQIFAGVVLDMGGCLHVVLPCDHYEARFQASADLAQFQALLARASHVEKLDYPEPSDDAYLAGGRRIVDLAELLVAVWDGRPPRGKGGTGDIVAYARTKGVRVAVVWPAGLERG